MILADGKHRCMFLLTTKYEIIELLFKQIISMYCIKNIELQLKDVNNSF